MEKDEYSGTIVGDAVSSGRALRVAYGKHWALGGNTDVSPAGEFVVPESARIVVAYVDANHNGRLDRFAEPSGDCRLTGKHWSCSIELRRTTLHRSITMRTGEHHDKTYVFWEDFLADGSRSSSQLCVEHRCTSMEAAPFLARGDSRVALFSICGEEGFSPQNAEIRGAGPNASVPITHPANLESSTRVEALAGAPTSLKGGDLHVEVATQAIDRVLIWAGRFEPSSGKADKVYWTSEDANIDIVADRTGISARLPAAEVERCRRDPQCEIVVQLLKYWNSPTDGIVRSTESRSTIAFREQL